MLGQMRGCTLANLCKITLIHVKFVRKSAEFRTNSPEFTPMNRLQASWVLAPLVLGAVWAWWMLLGRDLHWMTHNEAGARILPPQMRREELKIWRFFPKSSKLGLILANIHAPFKRPLNPCSRRVQLSPVTKGVRRGLKVATAILVDIKLAGLGFPLLTRPEWHMSTWAPYPSSLRMMPLGNPLSKSTSHLLPLLPLP